MSRPIRFYVDEHIPNAVVYGLRMRGVDVLTPHEVHMRGASDVEQLRFATNRGRVLVTHDDDFLRIGASGIRHAGIAYCPRRLEVGDYVRGLYLIHRVLDADEMENHVEYV